MLERLRNLIARHPAAAAFAAAALFLSLGAAGSEITRIDVRFAVMVDDLRIHGAGVFPTVNGFPYPDYFSPLVLLAYLTTFGGRWINLWSLSLPAILCASAVFALVVAIGEHRRRGTGVFAAALLAMSWEFLLILLSFGIDLPVTAAAALMIWSYECRPERRRTRPLLFFLLTLLSFAVRGPLGAILFGSVTGGYLLGSRRWRDLFTAAGAGFAGVVIAAAVAVRLIFRQGGDELWRIFLQWQIGSRIDSDVPFYYFTSAIGSFVPVTAVGVAAAVIHRRKLLSPEFAGWLGAIVLPLLLLSVPGCKHLRYMTPTLPFFALLGAEAFPPLFRRFEGAATAVTAFLFRALPWIVGAVFPLFAALGFVLWRGDFIALPNLAAGLLAALLLLRIAAPVTENSGRIAAIAATVMLVMTAGGFPIFNHFESSRPTVRRIEAERAGGRIFLYRIGPDHNDLKYRFHADPDAPAKTIWIGPHRRNPASHLQKMYDCRDVAQTQFRIGDLVLLERRREKPFRELPQIAGRFAVTRKLEGRLGHRTVFLLRLEPVAAPVPAAKPRAKE